MGRPNATLSVLCSSLCLTLAGAANAKAPVRIASKTFTESVILSEITAELERAAGLNVEHRVGLGGTRLVWDALVRGSVDVYPEYTGTLLHEVFADNHLPDTASDADQLAYLKGALSEHGIAMTTSLGFDDSYAVGLTETRARALGVQKISDLAAHPELHFGFSNEFLSRHDGFGELKKTYALPQSNVQGMDHDLAYRALVSGSIDATDLYTTDAEVKRYALLPLGDDRHFFQRYDAILLYRVDLAARAGAGAVTALERLQGRINASEMASLNARAKLDRVPETEVARAFVHEKFGVASTSAPVKSGVLHEILARTLEHLWLVAVSLLAAIALALPLGVLAAKKPRFGQVLLALVGVIQTLPTLALLVFMIPLFGIGGPPAMVALFLYSLLPIVRNTHAGLNGVPGPLLESARALGLPPKAILWRVELPLASPTILAGIKSAAVINVGTATLGALIGAGGLGQPIFTGIRLDNPSLIFQGAIPASLLALAVQGIFELIERSVVPRGLRERAAD